MDSHWPLLSAGRIFLQPFARIKDPTLHYTFYVRGVGDVVERVRFQDDEIGEISGRDGADPGAYLGSHLLRETEEEVEWDFARARLPRDLEPGETAEIALTVRLPKTPGRYILEFDMVAEHITWFEDHGSGTLRHAIVVE